MSKIKSFYKISLDLYNFVSLVSNWTYLFLFVVLSIKDRVGVKYVEIHFCMASLLLKWSLLHEDTFAGV